MIPVQLLDSRRPQDLGDDLWIVMSKVYENLIGGGADDSNPADHLDPGGRPVEWSVPVPCA